MRKEFGDRLDDPTFFVESLLAWWTLNQRSFKWRTCEEAYEVLIAELLLRRTNAKAAQKIFLEFLKHFPTAEEFSRGDARKIEELVLGAGLNWRAQNIVSLSKYFAENGTDIPADIIQLQQLPGIGPYVARAVSINCYGLKAVAIDSNIVRLLCRYMGIKINDGLRRNNEFQKHADNLVHKDSARSVNYALLDFSAAICTPHNPKCDVCPVASKCKTFLTTD